MEDRVKCSGCKKMKEPVIYIAEDGKVEHFCSYGCFKKVRK